VTPVAEVSNLRKSFSVRGGDGSREELVAVDGVTFVISAGGSTALVGESGSGKTTVARILAGLETATSGEVSLCGERRGLRERRGGRKRFARYVQMVFQDPYSSLDPRQTVAAAIEEALKEHFEYDASARRAQVQDLLDQVGLDARQATARPEALSGGQRQRAAIARALAVQPRLLILDEAVSALDVSVQAQIINLLIDLRAALDVAFLFISHDLAVVRQISDDCAVMHRGRIVERGTVDAVLDHPQDNYTRTLIDAIPRPGWRPRRRLAAAGD
jgi:peptide/nickel transport system ATP-binding protein